MSNGLHTNNPLIVSVFQSTLRNQALAVLIIVSLLVLAWNVQRLLQLRRDGSTDASSAQQLSEEQVSAEPIARRMLRISFGLIWIFDGILQGQASMPLGMTTQVIQPTAASSPTWVQHLVNAAATIWSNHPITAPVSAVWIQVGIGVWLLVAPRGLWSRVAGLTSAGWGIIVWIFGESFGGIFAPGLTWLFGAPGAVLFYSFAGLLIALPERSWRGPNLGRLTLKIMGLFFLGMAVLQAWPGRGFWQGRLAHTSSPGTLATMTSQMANTPQPHFFSSWVTNFTSFDMSHGWGVNLFVVLCLGAIGASFLSNSIRIVRLGVFAGIVMCLADWVLIEDFGFFGGTGTDPNSMLPMALIFIAGFLMLAKPLPSMNAAPASADLIPWRSRLTSVPLYGLRVLASLCAIGVIALGAAPAAIASMNPNADPIISQAVDGTPNAVNVVIKNFVLTNQFGRTVSLASLRGKVVALTFLDPVCVSDCPLIAQDFRQADALLGAQSRNVELVAIVINPLYRALPYLTAFDRQERLTGLSNWDYLTGAKDALHQVWNNLGMQVAYSTGGAMIAHGDIAYVLDANGHIRFILNSNPGSGTASETSSFAVVLDQSIRSALK